jgi:NAD(P)-dependent dehydrogenase (short-subunit alcohol dehydrogenase family)
MTAGVRGDGVLVTGCSTGLGLVTALHLARHGFLVHASVRDPSQVDRVKQAAFDHGVEVDVTVLDLADPDSLRRRVDEAAERSGGLYALVNNGGIGLRGCIEDTSAAEVRRLLEVNVLGTVEVTKAVLPHLRRAGRGRVVTITSVGGRISSFGVGLYCASKFAQEGLAEALALELTPFGLQSVIVEPGIIKTTRWDENRGTAAGADDSASPYYRLFIESEAIADRLVQRSRTRADDVAATVHTALTTDRPRMRYVVGRPAAAAIMARRYLPARVFETVYFGTFLRAVQRRAQKAGR